MYVLTQQGEEAFIADVGPGDCIGGLSTIGSEPRMFCEVTTPTHVFMLRGSDITGLLDTCPEIVAALLGAICEWLRDITQRYIEIRCLPMRTRLYAELLRLGQPSNNGSILIDPAPTHAEMARRIASQRETVTKEINRLCRDGIVKSSRTTIRILDPGPLHCAISNVLGLDFSGATAFGPPGTRPEKVEHLK